MNLIANCDLLIFHELHVNQLISPFNAQNIFFASSVLILVLIIPRVIQILLPCCRTWSFAFELSLSRFKKQLVIYM